MKNYTVGFPALALAAAVTFAASHSALAVTPTLSNVAYGTNPQQVLDFYQASSTKPTPVMFYIHGGGWTTGNKSTPDFLTTALASGISVVSIDYRLITGPSADGTPPVKMCFDDTARALQFVRSNAAAWNLDKSRVAAVGGSAGGYSALWLAMHDDMANPNSVDPIARESTRVTCAFTFVPQTTLDPVLMRQWMPSVSYGQQAFWLPSFQEYLNQRNTLLPFIEANSPYNLASADDPTVYMFYGPGNVPALGTDNYSDLVHSANWGAGLAAQMDRVGMKYEFNYPGSNVAHPDGWSFIYSNLTAPVPEPTSAALITLPAICWLMKRRR